MVIIAHTTLQVLDDNGDTLQHYDEDFTRQFHNASEEYKDLQFTELYQFAIDFADQTIQTRIYLEDLCNEIHERSI